MCEKCVKPKMRAKIELVYDVAGDFSDGAFFGYCEENAELRRRLNGELL